MTYQSSFCHFISKNIKSSFNSQIVSLQKHFCETCRSYYYLPAPLIYIKCKRQNEGHVEANPYEENSRFSVGDLTTENKKT